MINQIFVNLDVRYLEFLKKFKEKSTITEEDALKMGAELNKKLAKIYTKKV